MSRELKGKANGSCGATTITVTNVHQVGNGKSKRNQVGKLTVRKCFIVWHDKIETENNKFQVSWEEFISFMKTHPAN